MRLPFWGIPLLLASTLIGMWRVGTKEEEMKAHKKNEKCGRPCTVIERGRTCKGKCSLPAGHKDDCEHGSSMHGIHKF